MRQRWLPVGIVAGMLFGVNLVARLVSRFGFDDREAPADRLSLAMLVAVGLIGLGAAVVWGRHRLTGRWVSDLAAAALGGLVLAIFVGPFVSAETPFQSGAGAFFQQIWLWAAFVGGGALLGFMIITALGLDHRSQGLRRFAEARTSKPRRVVRR